MRSACEDRVIATTALLQNQLNDRFPGNHALEDIARATELGDGFELIKTVV